MSDEPSTNNLARATAIVGRKLNILARDVAIALDAAEARGFGRAVNETALPSIHKAGFRAGMERAAGIVADTSWPGTVKARTWAASVSDQLRARAPTEKP